MAEEGLVELARRGRYDTDKSAEYLAAYEEVFEPIRYGDVRLLELGVFHGGSLQLWRDYFPTGTISGLDLNPPTLAEDKRVKLFQGRQDDPDVLRSIRSKVAPGGFDIVIDDCSHFARETAGSYRILFSEHLKPGGIYAIEDWGTGYWPWWPDGAAYRSEQSVSLAPRPGRLVGFSNTLGRRKQSPIRSHQAGMVGFLKQLVDEVGGPDIQRALPDAPRTTPATIDRLIIRTGLAIAVKAASADLVPRR